LEKTVEMVPMFGKIPVEVSNVWRKRHRAEASGFQPLEKENFMSEKKCPVNCEQLEELTKEFPTPFHLYDEAAIRANARALKAAFAWNPGFKEYFAVKATPNPYLMKILKAEGFGSDCSSYPELLLSESVGVTGEDIIFTSNDTPAYEYAKAKELGAIINLDDISHIEFLEKEVGLPDLICCRYNPGALKGGNAIIGHPLVCKDRKIAEVYYAIFIRVK